MYFVQNGTASLKRNLGSGRNAHRIKKIRQKRLGFILEVMFGSGSSTSKKKKFCTHTTGYTLVGEGVAALTHPLKISDKAKKKARYGFIFRF